MADMQIGVLISSETFFAFAGVERLEEAGKALGHNVIRLFERKLSFHETGDPLLTKEGAGGGFTVKYDGQPMPAFDVIIVRPNFVEEPSLHQYAYDFLAKAGYRLVNGSGGVTRVKNKLLQRADLRNADIPMPRWAAAFNIKGCEEAIKDLGYPVILKTSFGTKGTGIFFVDKHETLAPIIDYLAVRDGNPIIVEEFIEEAQRSHLRVFVVGGEIVAAMEVFAKEGEVRSNAVGGSPRQVELSDQERAIALAAAKAMKLDISGVDILRSKRGPLVLEVNANPGFKELEGATKIDVAKKIIEFSLK